MLTKIDVKSVAESIKRLEASQIAELARILADDRMADKLIPAFDAEIFERDNALLRINDVPSED